LGDVSVDGLMILKCTLQEQYVKIEADLPA